MFDLSILAAIKAFGPWVALAVITLYSFVALVRVVLEWLARRGEIGANMAASAGDSMLRLIGKLEGRIEKLQVDLDKVWKEHRTLQGEYRSLQGEHDECLRRTGALERRLQQVENGHA